MKNDTKFRTTGIRAGLLTGALLLAAAGCDADVGVNLDVDSPNLTGGGGNQSVCGDGQLGYGEECDHGPANGPGKVCRSNCQLNACGDYDLGPGEECDDGPANGDHKACTSQCLHAVCGDGLVGPGEACDDGNKSNASLAKHPEATAPSLPGPIRCLAGVLRSPPEPDRARFATATTQTGGVLATRRQPASRVQRGHVAKRCQTKRGSGAFALQAVRSGTPSSQRAAGARCGRARVFAA